MKPATWPFTALWLWLCSLVITGQLCDSSATRSHSRKLERLYRHNEDEQSDTPGPLLFPGRSGFICAALTFLAFSGTESLWSENRCGGGELCLTAILGRQGSWFSLLCTVSESDHTASWNSKDKLCEPDFSERAASQYMSCHSHSKLWIKHLTILLGDILPYWTSNHNTASSGLQPLYKATVNELMQIKRPLHCSKVSNCS